MCLYRTLHITVADLSRFLTVEEYVQGNEGIADSNTDRRLKGSFKIGKGNFKTFQKKKFTPTLFYLTANADWFIFAVIKAYLLCFASESYLVITTT